TNYWVGGSSPVLDGNVSTLWSAGTFSGGGMCNVAVSQGSYNSSTQTFTSVPFGAIATIRIWAENYINSDGSTWNSMPQVVAVGYTTSSNLTGTISNGYSYNSGTVGSLPAPWTTIATILAVNGGTPGTPFDPTDYPTSSGWVAGDFSQGIVTGLNGGHSTLGYMDLSVNIPAGATSVMISFGQDGNSASQPTYYSPGGLAITDLQAFGPVPEPTSLGMLVVGAIGLLLLKRRKTA
ncbi:MAG: PEP-CTERM sorting domain-containing protein, partial [Phycisphaerae bacterium]|nr:PEP-CTERM sorting domain-containing protein [Phycisphaerae bacterium]